MTMKLKSTMIAGLTAAALSATMLAAAPAQAESRTFAYGTYGSAKYEGVGAHKFKVRPSLNRKITRSGAALRAGNSKRRHNFSSGNRYRSRIKISR